MSRAGEGETLPDGETQDRSNGPAGDSPSGSAGASVDPARESAWRGARRLGRPFWIFLAVSCLFNTGMFIYVLLYNLYLLDIGYKEDFLGLVSSVGTAGNMVGTFAAVALTSRVGLQRTVLICFACTSLLAALRALFVGETALLALSFCAGLVFALWAISITVVIARVTTPRERPLAFSLYLATVIGVGIFADPLGGRLPGWLGGALGATTAAQSKQAALLLSAFVIALALAPASRLRLPGASERARATYPRGSFVVRFLVAVALLNLATGAFNPFANVYFSQHLKMPVEDIGLVFSASQLAQVVAILLSPLILRRFGIVGGVVVMELAAGLSLGSLAAGPHGLAAAAAFSGYVAFQWMDEPAMESLLMTRVRPAERSGASALMYLVIFASGAVAAPLAGYGLTRYGYAGVIATAACVLVVGAVSFGLLLRGTDESTQARATAPAELAT